MSDKTKIEWCDYTFYRVGKNKAGRLFDGREWNQTPWQVSPKETARKGAKAQKQVDGI